MTAQEAKTDRYSKTRKRPLKPHRGSKAEAIITLSTTTPATPPQIAAAVKCSRQAVYDALARYHIQPHSLDTFKKHRADIFAGVQEDAMSRLAASDYTIATARDAKDESILIRNLFDCERLERGQSTANIAYQDVSARAKARDSEIEALKQELGINNSVDISST